MLFVWLFALATGIVHACVMLPALVDAAAPPCHEPAAAQDENTRANPAVASAQCMKFCGEQSSSVPSAKQAAEPSALWLALAPTTIVVAEPASDRGAAAVVDAPPPRARVPIRIAFLRLTR
jgi:hypothetical protein